MYKDGIPFPAALYGGSAREDRDGGMGMGVVSQPERPHSRQAHSLAVELAARCRPDLFYPSPLRDGVKVHFNQTDLVLLIRVHFT